VTLAASRLLGPDAAPAPRLATDKSTAKPSAKRRRIQLPLIVESRSLVVCSFGQTNNQIMLLTAAGCVNEKPRGLIN